MGDLMVLVPTRSRPHLVPRMVETWYQTGAFEVATLHFVLDADDMAIDQYKTELARHSDVDCSIRPEWEPLVSKLNHAARVAASISPFVAFMGDDHLPRTDDWARKLIAAHQAHPSSIVYGRDGFQDEALPTWWSMSSPIIRRLGRMVPAPVQHLYCDNAVMLLGQQTDRLVYLEDVLIEHMHPIVGKARSDAQYVRVNRPEQYERDRALFYGWVRDGLARDASLLADIG